MPTPLVALEVIPSVSVALPTATPGLGIAVLGLLGLIGSSKNYKKYHLQYSIIIGSSKITKKETNRHSVTLPHLGSSNYKKSDDKNQKMTKIFRR